MPRGRVDIRRSQRDGRYRLRFYGADEDQLEIIQSALKLCREESNTEFDLVALERLAMHFLSFGSSQPAPKPSVQGSEINCTAGDDSGVAV